MLQQEKIFDLKFRWKVQLWWEKEKIYKKKYGLLKMS